MLLFRLFFFVSVLVISLELAIALSCNGIIVFCIIMYNFLRFNSDSLVNFIALDCLVFSL
jgi:hypothetical protein